MNSPATAEFKQASSLHKSPSKPSPYSPKTLHYAKSVHFATLYQSILLLINLSLLVAQYLRSQSDDSEPQPSSESTNLYIHTAISALYIISSLFLAWIVSKKKVKNLGNLLQSFTWLALVPNTIENQIVAQFNSTKQIELILLGFLQILVFVLISYSFPLPPKLKFFLLNATIFYLSTRLFFTNSNLTFLIIGLLISTFFILFSITEMSLAKAFRLRSQEKDIENHILKLLLSEAEDGCLVLGNNRSIVYANSSVQSLLQHEGNEDLLASLEQVKSFHSLSSEAQKDLKEKVKLIYERQEGHDDHIIVRDSDGLGLDTALMAKEIRGKGKKESYFRKNSRYSGIKPTGSLSFLNNSSITKTFKSFSRISFKGSSYGTPKNKGLFSRFRTMNSKKVPSSPFIKEEDLPIHQINNFTSGELMKASEAKEVYLFPCDVPDDLEELFRILGWDRVLDIQNQFLNHTTEITGYIEPTKSTPKLLSVWMTPFYAKGSPFVMVRAKDISESESCKLLAQSETNRGFILSSVSHELRTPLNCIISMMGMLSDFVTEDLREEFIVPAYDSAVLLLSLVNDILDHSTNKAGTFKLNFFSFNLKDNLKDILHLMNTSAKSKGLGLELDVDTRIPRTIYSDPNRLRQIIINLVGNALKFTFKGSIKVHVGYISIDQYIISISDTGVGIKTEDFQKLFSKFSKISETESINGQGVGLGLVIANLLAKNLGPPGNQGIKIESQHGVGTTFSFLLESKNKNIEEAEANFERSSQDEEDDDKLDKNMASIKNWEDTAHVHKSKLFGSTVNMMDSKMTKTSLSHIKLNEQNTGSRDIKGFNSNSNFFRPSDADQQINSLFMKNRDNRKSSFFLQVPPGSYLINPGTSQEGESRVDVENPLDRSGELSEINSPPLNQQSRRFFSRNSQRSHLSQRSVDEKDQKILQIARYISETEKNSCILVVDDNPFNVLALQKNLEGFLFKVDSASNGDQAIQKILAKQEGNPLGANYSLVFMDCIMPKKDGYETTKEIRKLEKKKAIPFIPVIAVTASTHADDIKRCYDCGMNNYLTKPIDIKTLKEIILQYLSPQDSDKIYLN